jgi:hypothetical protein
MLQVNGGENEAASLSSNERDNSQVILVVPLGSQDLKDLA